MNLLSANPEFQRNLWVEITPQRLILMPLIIGLVVFVVSNGKTSPEDTLNIGPISLFMYTIIAFGWGTKAAGEGLLDEHNDKTWDWQRMSSIGPWRMLVGKLFGSTIYQWYGGIICLGIYLTNGMGNGYGERSLTVVFMAILMTILGYCMVMLTSLLQIKKSPERARIKNGSVFVIWLMIAVPILVFAFANQWLFDSVTIIYWFGMGFSPLSICFFFVLFYTVWSVIGLYRALRSELQYVTSANGWIGFLFSSVVFNAGLMANIPELSFIDSVTISLISAFSFYLVVVYYMALNEAKDIVLLRQVLKLAMSKNFKKLGEIAPLWLITLPLAFFTGILALLFVFIIDPKTSYEALSTDLFKIDKSILLALLISVFGFVIRDLALLLWINFNTSTRRADIASWVYLVFVYYLLPKMLGGSQISYLFYPDANSNIILLMLIPLAEAALAIYLLKNSWQKISQKLI